MSWLASLSRRGLLVAVLVFALDQASKHLMRIWVVPQSWDTRVILPVFNLNHAWNYGVSFSFFSDAGDSRRWLLIGTALLITAAVGWWLHKSRNFMQASACGLILGGAVGNICDRVIYGAVFDFLQFHLAEYYWPSFNLADSAIVLGVGLLLWDSWKGHDKRNASH